MLPLEPALAEKGAYSSHMVYSPEDVKRVFESVYNKAKAAEQEHDVKRILP